MNDEDDDPNAPIDFRSFGCGDPHCHIQALEGAIKGVILHLESNGSAKILWDGSGWDEDNAKVIANLRGLIHE